ncbi:MAG: DinB family protein [Bacteroidota bacterium]|nr:DinB family protein [Bacteroidota bacterium]
METKTVSHRIESFLVLYDMQTKFFSSVLNGISDEKAHERLNTKANHIAWLVGSLVEQRFEMANDIDNTINMEQTGHELFKNFQGIQDGISYPTLNKYIEDWNNISPILRKALAGVTEEILNSSQEMGGMQMTIFDMVSFCIYREANCIGQIALWRRLLGYEAMKYD